MSDTAREGRFGISWYGETASIGVTGFRFGRNQARKIAIAGSEAPDFWAWANAQAFPVDEIGHRFTDKLSMADIIEAAGRTTVGAIPDWNA